MTIDPKYSDITIILREGTIQAHRYVLSQMSDVMSTMIEYASKTNSPTLTFLDHSDFAVKTVIECAYKLSIYDIGRSMSYDEWVTTLYFAHYLNYQRLISMIISNHQRCSFHTICSVASELNIGGLFKESYFIMLNELRSQNDITDIISEICSLTPDDFMKLCSYDTEQNITTFLIYCVYCNNVFDDKQIALNNLIELTVKGCIKFHKFSSNNLHTCLKFPMFKGTFVEILLNSFLKLQEIQYQGTNGNKPTALQVYIDSRWPTA